MGLIESIAPQWALKRAIAKNRLSRVNNDIKRSRYGGRNRMNYDNLINPKRSANTDISVIQEQRRNNVRALEYNNPFISGPIRRIANNVVSTGFIFNSLVEDEGIRKPIEKYFKLWCRPDNCHLRRILHFNEILRVAEMSLIRDGEVLIVGSRSNEKRFTKYCLNVLEIDRLFTPSKYVNDDKVINGIRYDSEGAPKTYYISRYHPGDTIIKASVYNEWDEIPAYFENGERRVLHLFNPVRPEQMRGLTELCSTLDYYENLDKYSQAEIYAAIEDACLTGFVKSEDPENWADGNTENDPNSDNRIHEFAVNQIYYLNPNEDITYHSPTRPNSQFGEMINQLLRGPANGLDIPTEVVSQNWKGLNYSNARTLLLQFYHSMRIRQQHLVNYAAYYIVRNFIDSLILDKLIDPRIDREQAKQHNFITPGWQWVDPKKEADGKVVEWENNMDSLSDIISSRGRDPDDVFARILRDKQILKDIDEKIGANQNETQGENVADN